MADKTKKAKWILTIIAILVAVVFLAHLASDWNYSEGSRAGVITKFSKKGYVFKTWEGELSMGGVEQGGVARVWKFSVQDPVVAEKIEAAMTTGEHVKVTYEEKMFTVPWRGSEAYFAKDVIKAPKPK